MNVILEGPDASGKSTLAAHLHSQLSPSIWSLHRSGGPPTTHDEWTTRAYEALDKQDTIFDRHPVISESVYGAARGTSPLSAAVTKALYNQSNVYVYCCVPGLQHEEKPHDSPHHLQLIKSRRLLIEELYTYWAKHHAHLIYRTPTDIALITQAIKGIIL
jgi:hypothetical protein